MGALDFLVLKNAVRQKEKENVSHYSFYHMMYWTDGRTDGWAGGRAGRWAGAIVKGGQVD